MRVTFTDHIKTLSGKCHCTKDVFSSWHDDKICFLRRFTKPFISEHNHTVAQKFVKVVDLYPGITAGFKNDLNRYADAYNKQLLSDKKLPISGYNVFVMALCNNIVDVSNLDSLTDVATIYGVTINSWITAGLLENVKATFSGASIV